MAHRSASHPQTGTASSSLSAARVDLLGQLLDSSIVLAEDWDALPPEQREMLQQCVGPETLVDALVEAGLLTRYQAARISSGKLFGLVLGNYRVLDRVGAGGMGIVYRAEHVRMRRLVAIKVLPLEPHQDPHRLARFFSEIRSVAQLNHPNIVAAMDAGETPNPDPDAPTLYYLVMEYVQGLDLETCVKERGPMPVAQACDVIYQVASGLAEAHKHNLVHRDIKPPNIIVTPEGQAKLLDFGLVLHFRRRMTEPGTVLGTIDYIAPEQARDSSSVDIRADIYSLGGTLYWCLTGRPPFPGHGSLTVELANRLTQPPPGVRALRGEVPVELEGVIIRMMAVDPNDRYANPAAVMRALLGFLPPQPAGCRSVDQLAAPPVPPVPGCRVHRVLIVDDEEPVRCLCRLALQSDNIECAEARNGAQALTACAAEAFDLVVLDIDMPEMSGIDVVRRLRETPPCPNLKIIMFSGRVPPDELAQLLLAGADDFIAKPFSLIELLARVKASLRLKDAQDRGELLNRQLLSINSELDRNLTARDSDLVHARNALVLALAKLVEQRHTETGAHPMRLQRYCRSLAEEAACLPIFAQSIDLNFIQMLECCAPLHDIGKVALPDHILMKPGKLTPDERILMQQHTIMGAETLQQVARAHGGAVGFLSMGIDICRHHHERFDGAGYPDRLAGATIPLAARLVALTDVYDALRSRRVYKPPLAHGAALQIMLEASAGQFDPSLLPVLQKIAPRWEAIYREMGD